LITLILGGNKSGKSTFALEQLDGCKAPQAFIATGKSQDFGFRQQIIDHKIERSSTIPVIEVDTNLPQSLINAKGLYQSVLVDSMDFWVFQCIQNGCLPEQCAALEEVLSTWTGPDLIFVSVEIGLGPLPASSEARAFVRELGAVNQMLARFAHKAYFVAAGLPLTLKNG